MTSELPQLPHLNETFLDRYEVREVLGQGGFATIYGAWDFRLQRRVVLKILSPGRTGYGETTVARFKREGAIFAQLTSPNIVTMYDHGTSPTGLLYIVFEHVEGRDLKQVLRTHGPLDEQTTLHVVIQLLEALDAAHELACFTVTSNPTTCSSTSTAATRGR